MGDCWGGGISHIIEKITFLVSICPGKGNCTILSCKRLKMSGPLDGNAYIGIDTLYWSNGINGYHKNKEDF